MAGAGPHAETWGMVIARPVRRAPGPDRPTRLLAACVLALASLGATGTLASAAGPVATPTATPKASPAPTRSPIPSATPAPTATPAPWPTPAWPRTVTTLGSSVRFYGRGYGHGVGMSQYGARGRALAGQTAEQILAAYFRGAAMATVDPATPVRVLVLAGYPAPPAAPLVIAGRGGTWSLSGVTTVFPAGATLRAWRTTRTVDAVATTTWSVSVVGPDGKTVLYGGVLTGRPAVRPLEPGTTLQLRSRSAANDTYRGAMTLALAVSSASVVDTLGLDDYLRGVVPTEMPVTWPREALRAQVVAARSFAVRHLHPGTGSFDVFDDTRSQAYGGFKAERLATNTLILAEPGAVIRYGTAVINAFFFSTGGGATENNEFAFTGLNGQPGTTRLSYLRGIVDRSPAGVPYDAAAPRYGWVTSSLTRAQLSAMFRADARTDVGDLTRLDLRRRGVSGRLYQVVLYGSAGSKTVSADAFLSVYNARKPAWAAPLRSNLFDTQPIP
jgi:SpoIID/LytB domain protein